jgi:exonuclease VII small subunit
MNSIRLCEKRLKKAERLLEWALADLQDLDAGMEVIGAIRTFLEQRGKA